MSQTNGKGLRVVYTAGVFDLLHRGHLNVLWASRQLGDLLIVGVVSDAGVVAYKHRSPIENAQLRMARLARLPFVDVIDIQPTTDPTPMLERYRPDVFTHADGEGDWSTLRERVADANVHYVDLPFTSGIIEYVDLPYTPGVSTTLLRQRAGV
jgi:glycerol-3-phosphate cytidylyltransferase